MTDGLPPFPLRRPEWDTETWAAIVGDWQADGAIRRAYVVAATASGHAADVGGYWGDSARQARLLRGYLGAKLGEPMSSWGTGGPPLDALDPDLVAAANGCTLMEAHAVLDAWGRFGVATLRRAVSRWRERGRGLLAAYPDLGLDRPEPGRPRGLALPDDASAPMDELARVAPGTAPGSAAQIAALVTAALRGDLRWEALPHGVAAAVLVALEARAIELGRVARVPSAAAGTTDADAIVADLLLSHEWQVMAAALQLALTGGRAVVVTLRL